MSRAVLIPIALAQVSVESVERQREYCNPLPVLVADPQVLKHESTYYLYGTSMPDRGYLAWSSSDLVNWQLRGLAYTRSDRSFGVGDFWAPEVVEHQGHYLLHYCARGKQGRRICVARSDSPIGPFVDVKAPMFDFGTSDIDAHVFQARDGQAWLFFVREFPNRIFVAPLSADLTSLSGAPTQCLAPDQPWENGIDEGPSVLEHDGTLYLFYSGQGFDSPDYSIGVATAKSPRGPWTKEPGNPILHRTALVSGPGHNSIIRSPDGKELFVVYHTQQQVGGAARQLAIDRLTFVEDAQGRVRPRIDGPTRTAQPLPSGAPGFATARTDRFDTDALDRSQWIVFNEDPQRWRLRDGWLRITTTDGDLWQWRADVRNVFLQQAPLEDFSCCTRVRFTPRQDFEQAFLVVFQDHNNFVRFSWVWAEGPKLEFAVEKEGHYTSSSVPAPECDELWLRVRRVGVRFTFATSRDGTRWQAIGDGVDAGLEACKIGLGAAAPRSGRQIEASFDFFHVERDSR